MTESNILLDNKEVSFNPFERYTTEEKSKRQDLLRLFLKEGLPLSKAKQQEFTEGFFSANYA